MINYQKVDLEFQNRINMMNSVDEVLGEPEMSEFESAFLARVIKKIKPRKVLEIGVAAGGTSAIILDSLEMYSSEYSFFSLDLNDMFYMDKGKQTGFLAEQYKQVNPLKKGNHVLITGNYAPKSLSVVGDQIDLLIIDTVHSLPGEILDFIAFYPNLSKGEFIVIHDTVRNHMGNIKPNRSYATKVLFDFIKADKYVNFDESEEYLFPNIAAFRINQKTSESILDLIIILTISWEYYPTKEEIDLYSDAIKSKYGTFTIELWDKVVEQQHQTMRPEKKYKRYYSISVKSGSVIYWLYLIGTSTKFLIDNGPIAFIGKVIDRLRHA